MKRGVTPSLESLLRGAGPRQPRPEEPESFRSFGATELYCPKCNIAMPVREKMLLVLPGGDLYDYTCTRCGTVLGKKQG